MYLDRVLSDADLLKQRQREAAMAREKGGVKVAPQYLSQYTDDGSTPRSSLYLSGDSMAGSEVPTYFYSSTNIPGYSTDDSSKVSAGHTGITIYLSLIHRMDMIVIIVIIHHLKENMWYDNNIIIIDSF